MIVKNNGKSQIIISIQYSDKTSKFEFPANEVTEIEDKYAAKLKTDKYFKMYIASSELSIISDVEEKASVKKKDDSVSTSTK